MDSGQVTLKKGGYSQPYPYLASLTLPCHKVHQFKNVLFCTAERGQGFPRGRSKRVFSVMRDLSDIIGWAVLTVFP